MCRVASIELLSTNRISRNGTAVAAICATRSAIFSASFNVETIIETELSWPAFGRRADDGIRTRDLRFTKPLLYQLSYVGASGKDDIAKCLTQATLQLQNKCLTNLA